MSFCKSRTWLIAAFGLCACGSTGTTATPDASEPTGPVTFLLDGAAVDVTDTRVVAEDGAKAICTSIHVLGATRLDIHPGLGTGRKTCAQADIGIFDPTDATKDLATDKGDPSCTITVTSNGESNLFAGSFEGDLVNAKRDQRHKVSISWSVRP